MGETHELFSSSALQLFTFFIIWLFSYTVNADPAHCVANAGNPPADAVNSVRFKRFVSINNTTHFYPLFESGFQQISSSGWQRTASPLALFHHYGKWWVGLKLALSTGNGGIRWYSSTTGDTDTWQLETSTGFTANGASGIGDWTVSNYLRWGE